MAEGSSRHHNGYMIRPPNFDVPVIPTHTCNSYRRSLRQALGAAVVVVALGAPLVAGAASASGATRTGASSSPPSRGSERDDLEHRQRWSRLPGHPERGHRRLGPAVTVLPDGKVDPEHTNDMELELRHGTFSLYIDGIASKFRAQTTHEPLVRGDVLGLLPRHRHRAGRGRDWGTGCAPGASAATFRRPSAGNEDQETPPCGSGFASQVILLTGSGTVSS